MKAEHREWLVGQGYASTTVNTQLTQAARVERQYGDLDAAYDADRFAAILQSLRYSKADERANRPNPSRLEIDGALYANLAGYRTSLSLYRRFRESIDGTAASPQTSGLEDLKRRFLERCPDFSSFEQTDGTYWKHERHYKNDVIAAAGQLMAVRGSEDEEALGRAMIQLLKKPPANFVGWRTFSDVDRGGPEAELTLARAIGKLLKSSGDIAQAVATAAAAMQPLFLTAKGTPSFSQTRQLASIPLALTRPQEAIDVKTTYMEKAFRRLTGRGLFASQTLSADEYGALLTLADHVFEVMRDEWDWAPRDLWDVQGFFWIAVDDTWGAEAGGSPSDDASEPIEDEVEPGSMRPPLNQIFYGPPGTGKTWITAQAAVQICDGSASEDRAVLMERYRTLKAAGRIEFVTFHQSMAYEDFVEGLRPTTEPSDDAAEGPGPSGGFRLEVVPGVFRRIAAQAEQARSFRPNSPGFALGDRGVFKMSLGRAADQGEIYQAAIDGGYIALGGSGEIDWSDPKFNAWGSIRAEWLKHEPDATPYNRNVVQMYTFRNDMKVGDIVVVSDGNQKFRAFGEITGPYEFALHPKGFNHRRPVRWLSVFDKSQPVQLIYDSGFQMQTVYRMAPGKLKREALADMLGETRGQSRPGPERFVLIIDEINRANVSKVLGELITLIEPDKRLGESNALEVTLPYSNDSFGVPNNLHIIATMNTADRSIALLDTALRRRFRFVEMMPDSTTLVRTIEGVQLGALLDGINRRIEYLFDRDHQIGHAYFTSVETIADLDAVMRDAVIPLLVEYFYEDWEKVRAVLNDADAGFIIVTELAAPPLAGDQAESRRRYGVRGGAFPLSAYESACAGA